MRAILALLLASQAFGAWVRLQTSDIELITDVGEKAGRSVLDRFAEIRAVFEEEHPVGRVALRVFLFRSEADFRAVAPTRTADGFFQSDAERDMIVLHAGPGVPREAAHEFVHLLISQSGAPLPSWLEEGTAELYSNIAISRGRATIGAPIPEHVQALQRSEIMVRAQPGDALFYPQSWALAHYFTFSPEWRTRSAGMQSGEQFLNVVNAELDIATRKLPAYARSIRGTTVAAPSVSQTVASSVAISNVEGQVLHAELALATGHREVAVKLLASLPTDHADVETARAMLAIADDRRDEAMKLIEHALSLPNVTARTFYEAAALEQDRRAPWARVKGLLEKAVELDPGFGEAHFLLGSRATDDADYPQAITRLQDAVKTKPRNASYWNALAYAQAKAGMKEDAKSSARYAERAARTQEQERMAQTLLESLN